VPTGGADSCNSCSDVDGREDASDWADFFLVRPKKGILLFRFFGELAGSGIGGTSDRELECGWTSLEA